MGMWMKENIGGRPAIVSRKPFVPFYAGGVAIFLPDLDQKAIFDFMKTKDADYLVIDERSIRRYRYENIKPFLENDFCNDFTLVKEVRQRSGYKIRLFKIAKDN